MPKQQQQSSEATLEIANIVGQIGCLTTLASLIIIGLAFGIGFYLDDLLGTRPIFTFIALAGSFPITLYAIVQLSMRTLARAQRRQERAQRQQEQRHNEG